MMGHALVVIFGDQCWSLNNDEGVTPTLYNPLNMWRIGDASRFSSMSIVLKRSYFEILISSYEDNFGGIGKLIQKATNSHISQRFLYSNI